MNQQYRDILTIIERHGPITTGDICEKLTALGYGGAMSWEYFRDSVAKQLGYLKNQGDVTGKDKPQTKGKPLRYWSLAKADTNPTLEMASDVAYVELVKTLDSLDTEREIQERRVVAETITPEPAVSVDVKASNSPMTVQQALANKPQWMGGNEFTNFLLGIEAAEKHHGIGQ